MTDSSKLPPNISPDPNQVSVNIDRTIGDTFVSPSAPNARYTEVTGQQITAFEMRHHNGPLPDPDTLRQYGTIDPTLPGRIMAMAEKGHGAQIEREKEVLQNSLTIELAGRLFALIFSVLVLILAAFVAYLGEAKYAAAIVAVILGTAVYTIISGKEARGKSQKPRVTDTPEK